MVADSQNSSLEEVMNLYLTEHWDIVVDTGEDMVAGKED